MLEKLPEAVGHALRERRAGLDHVAAQRLPLRTGTGALAVTSLAFADHAPIPAHYTADGEGRSPPLEWSGVPDSAGSVVLIVEDADAPTPQPLVHGIAVNLPPGDGALHEGALDRAGPDTLATGVGVTAAAAPDPSPGALPEALPAPLSEPSLGPSLDPSPAPSPDPSPTPALGRNSLLLTGWLPPDPPPGHGVHRYVFQVFALAPEARLSGTPGRDALLEAVAQHGIASGWLIGTYERPDTRIRIDARAEAMRAADELPASTLMPLARD